MTRLDTQRQMHNQKMEHRNSPKKKPRTNCSQQRRSRRNATAPQLRDLARHIVSSEPIVFITGAGLSAASGIRTFRGPDGLWSEGIWRKATRKEFRKDPLRWYNDFWVSVLVYCFYCIDPFVTNFRIYVCMTSSFISS